MRHILDRGLDMESASEGSREILRLTFAQWVKVDSVYGCGYQAKDKL